MREDMDEVIIERPRFGSSRKNHEVRWDRNWFSNHKNDPESLEAMPKTQKMSPGALGYDLFDGRKELNENLNPLYRFLDRQIGRKWDDVYSEIRKNINPNSAVQMHILQHVKDHVSQNVFIEDGKVYNKTAHYGRYYELGVWRRSADLYVDPADGILKRVPKVVRTRPVQEITVYDLGNKTYLKKLDKIWYLVQYGLVKRNYSWFGAPPKDYWEEAEICKKQLNKKELKKYGLSNG